MIVFVVTTGCYSDYGINGIFSTRVKAQQYIDGCRAAENCWNKDFNDIEKWTLDEALAEKTYTRFCCGIMLDDGAVLERHGPQELWGVPKSTTYVAEDVPAYGGRGIVRAESSKSAKHAQKLAVEARQAWLRAKKGAKQ